MTLNEVKNKIRIYRTIYSQELKKMEKNNGTLPRLGWFLDLHKAFKHGKIKSFTKSPAKKFKSDSKVEKLFEIEYQNESPGGTDDEKVSKESESTKSLKLLETEHQIIIEPYEDEYEDVEYQEFRPGSSTQVTRFKSENTSNGSKLDSSLISTGFTGNGMQSNELFLKSLQATLDKLPDAKNMRARIQIQEILYKIAYEVDK